MTPKEDHPHPTEHHEHQSMGQKIKKFLFEAPTEETMGMTPPAHQDTKPEALHDIHEALEHPLARQHHFAHSEEHPKKRNHQKEGQHPKKEEHERKTMGQKIKKFLFEAPTEATMGMTPPAHQDTKSEALHDIHEALEHPLARQHHFAHSEEHPKERNHQKEDQHPKKEEHEHKTMGQKIKKFLFEAPTEETMGMTPPAHQDTKSEALHDIHEALEHPLARRHHFAHSD